MCITVRSSAITKGSQKRLVALHHLAKIDCDLSVTKTRGIVMRKITGINYNLYDLCPTWAVRVVDQKGRERRIGWA